MPKTLPSPVQIFELTHKAIDNMRIHVPIVPGNPDYAIDASGAFVEGTGLHYDDFSGNIVGSEQVRVDWAALPQNIKDALIELHTHLENQLTDIT